MTSSSLKTLVLCSALFAGPGLQAKQEPSPKFTVQKALLVSGESQVAATIMTASEVQQAGFAKVDHVGLLKTGKSFVMMKYALVASQPAEFFTLEKIGDTALIQALQPDATVEGTSNPLVKTVTASVDLGTVSVKGEANRLTLGGYNLVTNQAVGTLTKATAEQLASLDADLGRPQMVASSSSVAMSANNPVSNSVGTEAYYLLPNGQTLIVGYLMAQVSSKFDGAVLKLGKNLIEKNAVSQLNATVKAYQSL